MRVYFKALGPATLQSSDPQNLDPIGKFEFVDNIKNASSDARESIEKTQKLLIEHRGIKTEVVPYPVGQPTPQSYREKFLLSMDQPDCITYELLDRYSKAREVQVCISPEKPLKDGTPDKHGTIESATQFRVKPKEAKVTDDSKAYSREEFIRILEEFRKTEQPTQ